MRNCLVGSFVEIPNSMIGVVELRCRASRVWSLKRGLKLSILEVALFLFDFEDRSEGEGVLARSQRRFKENVLDLERWNPKVGCCHKGVAPKKA